MSLKQLLNRRDEICFALIEADNDSAIELTYELQELEAEIEALGGDLSIPDEELEQAK